MHGSLAQLVEQRIEAPCVPSSSLGGATILLKKVQIMIYSHNTTKKTKITP
jgi:hypothetical protein